MKVTTKNKIKLKKTAEIYTHSEVIFERLVSLATIILGNSITFILAVWLVLFWWINNIFTTQDIHEIIGDIIFGTTFISLFIIQKSFNRFSASLHLKIKTISDFDDDGGDETVIIVLTRN